MWGCVWQTAVTEWILPCIDQALTDNESCVITNALNALAVLYELQLLDPKVMLDFLEKHVAVMVCHPVLPVRHTQTLSRLSSSSCLTRKFEALHFSCSSFVFFYHVHLSHR